MTDRFQLRRRSLGLWQTLTRSLQRWRGRSAASHPHMPGIQWLEADQTPFGVRVLDVAPLARAARSRPEEPEAARAHRAALEATTVPPDTTVASPRTPCSLRFRADPGGVPDGAVFRPRVLEEKWALYLQGPHLFGVRSWTGSVAFVLDVTQGPGHLTVTGVRGDPGDGGTDPDHRARVVDFLLRSLGLGEILPAPVPLGLADASGEDIGRALFQRYGRRALAATVADLRLPRPDRPLRVDTPTWLAAAQGDVGPLRSLLGAGGHPETPGVFQGTRPLHAAAALGATACVALLLEHGAEVDALDDTGASPLLAAARQHGPDVTGAISLLVEHGADPRRRLPDGATALHLAARAGRTGVVRALLRAGADATAADHRGFTPLHSAAELGIVPLVAVLLDHGADPHHTAAPADDGPPVTPLDLARSRGHTDALARLEAAG